MSYDTEPDYDYVFVEAHHVGQDDWTTLPDANGHTSDDVGLSCDINWDTLHPFLAHYQTNTDKSQIAGDEDCTPDGTTGHWNAATGNSGGYQDWKIDLSAYAGAQVEVSITYAQDFGTGGLGVFVDDAKITKDGVVTDSTSFEDGLGGFTAGPPPAGSEGGTQQAWTSRTTLGYKDGPGVQTPRSVYWGFGLEGVTAAAKRAQLMTSRDGAPRRDRARHHHRRPAYPAAVLADNPAGYWRMGEASGTTMVDSSPAHNNGAYLNGVALGQPGAVAGNTAAKFDGVNDTARVPQSASLNVGSSFSAEAWIKRTSTASSQVLFNKGANGIQLLVMQRPHRQPGLAARGGVGRSRIRRSPILADGRYHHIVATMNGAGTAKIYVDGVIHSAQDSAGLRRSGTRRPRHVRLGGERGVHVRRVRALRRRADGGGRRRALRGGRPRRSRQCRGAVGGLCSPAACTTSACGSRARRAGRRRDRSARAGDVVRDLRLGGAVAERREDRGDRALLGLAVGRRGRVPALQVGAVGGPSVVVRVAMQDPDRLHLSLHGQA